MTAVIKHPNQDSLQKLELPRGQRPWQQEEGSCEEQLAEEPEAKGSNLKTQARSRESELEMVLRLSSNPTSNDILLNKVLLPQTPKKRNQVETKNLNAWDYGGYFSFKSQHFIFLDWDLLYTFLP